MMWWNETSFKIIAFILRIITVFSEYHRPSHDNRKFSQINGGATINNWSCDHPKSLFWSTGDKKVLGSNRINFDPLEKLCWIFRHYRNVAKEEPVLLELFFCPFWIAQIGDETVENHRRTAEGEIDVLKEEIVVGQSQHLWRLSLGSVKRKF